MEKEQKLLFFTTKKSIHYNFDLNEVKKLLAEIEKISPIKLEIIDIDAYPDKAEQYKIDALPVIIMDNKRFIGRPKVEKILLYLQLGS